MPFFGLPGKETEVVVGQRLSGSSITGEPSLSYACVGKTDRPGFSEKGGENADGNRFPQERCVMET